MKSRAAKSRKIDYKNNVGLILVAIGVALWLLPFAIVAMDNVIGATKPADVVIGTAGVFILTVSTALILIGILLIILKFLKKSIRS